MSLPSDANIDIPPSEPTRAPRSAPTKNRMTPEQQGWIVAALVAFLGITYFGPAVARYRSCPSMKERIARRLRDSRRQAEVAGKTARKRMRRLGGGSVWR